VVKFGSQQEKEQCMTLFFTTKYGARSTTTRLAALTANPCLMSCVVFIRSKSHRVAFVDIIAVSSSSRSVPVASPRNDGRAASEKDKLAKEKEKQAKEKEEKKKRETMKKEKEKGKEKKGDKKSKGKGKKEEPPADALTSIMNGFSSFYSSISGPAPEESKGKKNKK
jgi:Mn-containing catalase